jgi:hypothetical protein
MEQAFGEDWFTSPARPGIAATSTPLSSSACVTLKSTGSKVLAMARVVKAPVDTTAAVSLMVASAVDTEREFGSGTETGQRERCRCRCRVTL